MSEGSVIMVYSGLARLMNLNVFHKLLKYQIWLQVNEGAVVTQEKSSRAFVCANVHP